MKVTFKVDTREFQATRKEAMKYTRRTLAEALNTNLFFIGRRAVLKTPKVTAERLATEFGEAQVIRASKRPRPGRPFVKSSQRIFGAMIGNLARLGVIINARRIKAGKKPLTGAELEKAMNKVYAARQKSRAFIASGWLPGIAILDVATTNRRGVPPRDGSVKRVGATKGGASVAREFWVTSAKIWNTASTKRDHKQALIKYGEPALQASVDEETAKLQEHIEMKCRERLERIGVKFL